LAKRGPVYKREKRKKELLRQKKQEEKREKRFKKVQDKNIITINDSYHTDKEIKE